MLASRAIDPCPFPLGCVNIAPFISELATTSVASLDNLLCRFLTLFYYSHITFSFQIHSLQSPTRQPPKA